MNKYITDCRLRSIPDRTVLKKLSLTGSAPGLELNKSPALFLTMSVYFILQKCPSEDFWLLPWTFALKRYKTHPQPSQVQQPLTEQRPPLKQPLPHSGWSLVQVVVVVGLQVFPCSSLAMERAGILYHYTG